ncbi:hypothetical protein B0H13DRAFT_2350763 [Mycena leptocephala]|nr:hypothetical protein B0H13DRAFT_2350763 [Mycena leptocephala]
MTVVVYQGETRRRLGGGNSRNILDFVSGRSQFRWYLCDNFHDDLVPIEQFLDDYRQSVMSTVYLYARFNRELQDAERYFEALGGAFKACWNVS